MDFPNNYECKVTVIGLGYVGLPLALEISKNKQTKNKLINPMRKVVGFDINKKRIDQLKKGVDSTNEISKENLHNLKNITFSSEFEDITSSDVFIVTVPTPVDNSKKPDLKALKSASELVGKSIKLRDKKTVPIVIYESTVYPGATEEVCIPIIEHASGFYLNKNATKKTFVCGYSPERINPGDKTKTISDIKKVTSGSSKIAADWIDDFYSSFISAGTYKASSIKVAEAAKVIENTQRDLNIALMNELSIIFKKLNIDTLDVLKAAETKWNFHKFYPGLVGGHCIGVDPYYLTYKSEQCGYKPEVLLAGRRINDSMSDWITQQLIQELFKKRNYLKGSKVLILGMTFKENCSDIRNSKVVDIIYSLRKYDLDITICDPYVDINQAKEHYDLEVSKKIDESKYIAIIAAVAHDQFRKMKEKEWTQILNKDGILFDLKGIVPRQLNPYRI